MCFTGFLDGFVVAEVIEAITKLVAKRDNADALEAASVTFANLTVNNSHNSLYAFVFYLNTVFAV